MDPPRSVNLSELSGTVEIEPGYQVELPDDDCLILVAGAKYPAAATRYDHPHLAAWRDEVFQTRAYWPDGRKKWFQHAGRDFYFVIPRDRVALVFSKGFSFVPVLVNGLSLQLNVSGGGGDTWTDYVGQRSHVGIGLTKRKLELLAQAALPPAEARQRANLELTELSANEVRDFLELMAGQICRERLAVGHQLFLQDGYSFDDRQGPFYVESKTSRRRVYFVRTRPDGGTRVRVPYQGIDWTATAAANNFDVPTPELENRLGSVQPGVDALAKSA
jgi:hypothetical protein